jgi:hypothetical protein
LEVSELAVDIATDCGLKGRGIEVLFLAEARDFVFATESRPALEPVGVS